MASSQVDFSQLLPLLLAAGDNPVGKPLQNAAPTFNSPTGGMGGGGIAPNFGQGAIMPQMSNSNMASMLPLLMAMNKNQNSGSSGGGKGGGLLGSMLGKGGPGGSDFTAELAAPGNADALASSFGAVGL